ncbi:protein phosphatase 2C domain-containing protein [Helicobacter suis]|uniref:protein phosphatase 2C domain-containing protein n=1 Tax=Helicobacter suis TaxID=104628 RepID=UPI0013D635E6|nr:protein phosphatase 2C domain-containing protein [Helicobacter suis]
MAKWKAFGHALQGRSHLQENPPIPCQDKYCLSDDQEVCVIALADGAGSAKFSHFGAKKSVEVVIQVLEQKFDAYFGMPTPQEVREDIIAHVLQALNDLAKTKTKELLQDRSDIDLLVQKMLQELRALESRAKGFLLPLQEDLKDAKDFLNKSYANTLASRSKAYHGSLECVKKKLESLQTYAKNLRYFVDFKDMDSRLEDLKKAIGALCFKPLFENEEEIDAFVEKSEEKYKKIDHILEKHIGENKGAFGVFFKQLVSKEKPEEDIKRVRIKIKSALANLPKLFLSASLPPKAIKNLSLSTLDQDLQGRFKALRKFAKDNFNAFNVLIDDLHKHITGLSFKVWSTDNLKDLQQEVDKVRDASAKQAGEMSRYEEELKRSFESQKEGWLREIKQFREDRQNLEGRFKAIDKESHRILDDLVHAGKKICESLLQEQSPLCYKELLQVLYKIEQENLPTLFANFDKQVNLSQALHRDLKDLRQNLGITLQPSSEKSLLISLPTSELLKAVQTLREIKKELESIKEKQQKLEDLQSRVKSLSASLEGSLKNVAVQSCKLQEEIKKWSQSYNLKDLQNIQTASLDKSLEQINETLKQEIHLTKEAQNLFQRSFKTTPSFLGVSQHLKSLQDCLQKKTCELKDLASTLLAVAVRGDDYLWMRLGDGELGVLMGSELKAIGHAGDGEFSNETTFVTSKDAVLYMLIGKGNLRDKNIQGFVLMSDGSAESFYDNRKKKLVDKLRSYMRVGCVPGIDLKMQTALEQLMERVRQKTFDDCSIAMLLKQNLDTKQLNEKEQELYGQVRAIKLDQIPTP